MTSSIISFTNVTKTFGELTVLDDMTITIRAGEKVAVIGPSGSGKSTMLRLLMTLEKPDRGVIEIDGENLWQMTRRGKAIPSNTKHIRKLRAKIGMVFQHFNLFPHMTVLANVTQAPIHVKNMPRSDAMEKAKNLLDMVGLSDKFDAYPSQLSGGQKQRVAIARALAMEPQIMLFDEVTSALDPELVAEVLKVICSLAQKTNMTMLIVTHHMAFAKDISDRVLFFDQGKIIEDTSPGELFNSPRENRTKEFLNAISEGI